MVYGLRNGVYFSKDVYAPKIKAWHEQAPFNRMAVVADFKNNRYAVTTVAAGSIPGATNEQLCVKTECAFSDLFTVTTASTTQRAFRDASGAWQNNLAANTPRFDFRGGFPELRTRVLARSDDATNLFLNSLAPATQTIAVASSSIYMVSVYGTGSLTLTGAGVGVASEGRPFIFTASSTSLTATVTGTLQAFQCELQTVQNLSPSDIIATTDAPATRAREDIVGTAKLIALMQRSAGTALVKVDRVVGTAAALIGTTGGNNVIRMASGSPPVQAGTDISVGGILGSGTSVNFTDQLGAAVRWGATTSIYATPSTETIPARTASLQARNHFFLGRNEFSNNRGNIGYEFVALSPYQLSNDEIKAYTRPWGSPIAPIAGWSTIQNNQQVGGQWIAQNNRSQWALTMKNGVYRFEVNKGDRWVDEQESNLSERSEVYGFTIPNANLSSDVWVSFALFIENGVPSTSTFCSLFQILSTPTSGGADVSPPVMLNLVGGSLQLQTRSATADPLLSDAEVTTVTRLNEANSPRGVWTNYVLKMRFSPSGFGTFDLWRNGVPIISVTGIALGYANRSIYPKFGIYRSTSNSGQPISVRYANVEVAQTSLLARVASPLAIPTTT